MVDGDMVTLVHRVCEGVNSVTPSELECRERSQDIEILYKGSSTGSFGFSTIAHQDGASDQENLRAALWGLLSHVQDTIIEATSEPWPEEPGSADRSKFPLPRVDLMADIIHWGYSSNDAWVIQMTPIGAGSS